ncbi:MAG: DUF6478 family protein, partial [Pseudomonadota bacterium]
MDTEPSTLRSVREIDPRHVAAETEFDIALGASDLKRLKGIWLELIFETPGKNRITIHDVVLSRRHMAQM